MRICVKRDKDKYFVIYVILFEYRSILLHNNRYLFYSRIPTFLSFEIKEEEN